MPENSSEPDIEIVEHDERSEAQRKLDPHPDKRDPVGLDPMSDPAIASLGLGPNALLQVVNRALIRPGKRDEGVPDCLVRITSARRKVVEGSTNAHGNVELDLSPLGDGVHDLLARSPDTERGPVGPNFPSDPSKDRVWSELTGKVHVVGGEIKQAEPSDWVHILSGKARIALQPMWMRGTDFEERKAVLDSIVIHHTGKDNLRSNVRHFLYSGQVSVHYLVAPNGEVYKMVDETKAAWHAGRSIWKGQEELNQNSIGIEMTHETGQEYHDEQVRSVVDLVSRLLGAHTGIPATRVIGHSDVALNLPKNRPPKRHGRKSTDPGSAFPWEELEARGVGLIAATGAVDPMMYGGYFVHAPYGALRKGDSDRAHRYGGVTVPQVSGAVKELQRDLSSIGYYCEPFDGHYGDITRWALQMFEQHMFSGQRRRGPDPWNSGDGRLDRDTAELIKRVLGEVTSPNMV